MSTQKECRAFNPVKKRKYLSRIDELAVNFKCSKTHVNLLKVPVL